MFDLFAASHSIIKCWMPELIDAYYNYVNGVLIHAPSVRFAKAVLTHFTLTIMIIFRDKGR